MSPKCRVSRVSPIDGKQFCFIGASAERREVEIGEFNDEFIEIKRGLKQGDEVALRAPVGTDKEPDQGKKPPATEKPKPAPSEPIRVESAGS